MKPQTLRRIVPYLFLFPSLLLLVSFVYAPAVENMVYSLFSWSSVRTESRFVGLENYRELFSSAIFWRALFNNVLYAIISILFQVFFALVIAAVLVAGVFGPLLRNFFRTAFFLPSILPVTVVGLLWQLIYQPTIGLIDQILFATGLQSLSHVWLGEEATVMISVILVSQWQWTGYMIVLFMVAIQAIPNDLYEALRMEGASRVQQFFHITMPGVRESTLILAIITIFGSFKVFDIVWVMTAGGPNNASEVLGTHMYRSAFRNDVSGYAAAVATVIFFITLAVGIVQIRLQRQD
jgi:raffinose/stachyose/melibiose transport system permease protein